MPITLKYHVSTEKEYNEYYLNQLKEILGNPKYGNNGKFIEVWMDGARGSGAQKVTYTFDEWFKYIKEAEGDIAIFSAQQQVSVGSVMNVVSLEIQFGIRLRKLKSLTM